MKKFALIAVAATFAVSGAVSTASAARADRDGTLWRQADVVQVAGRGGDKGGRNDGGKNNGGRDAHRGKKDNRIIWPLRGGKHRPFWRFHRDRGPDCFVRKMQVENADGSVSIRNIRICE